MEQDNAEKKRDSEIRDNELLAGYISEFQDDVKITNYNLREKSMTTSAIWGKWLQYLYKEKENMQRISDAKRRVVKQKMQSCKMTDSVLRMKSEDRLSETDETMKKLNALEKKTQTNIEYIERALNVLQNFGFNVKNAIDAWKLNFEH